MKPNNAFKPVTSKQSITVQDEAYSEAMDEAYSEAMDEIAAKDQKIAQLKAANMDLGRECLKRGTTIADLQRLLTRAADALEVRGKIVDQFLIDELRKAAE